MPKFKVTVTEREPDRDNTGNSCDPSEAGPSNFCDSVPEAGPGTGSEALEPLLPLGD